jgi:hypothetical protein
VKMRRKRWGERDTQGDRERGRKGEGEMER